MRPRVPVLAPFDKLQEERLRPHRSPRPGWCPCAAAMALIGLPSATSRSRSSSAAVEARRRRVAGCHERFDDLGVEHRAAGGDLADGAGELVAFGHPILEEVGVPRCAVGEERDGVLRVVVLRRGPPHRCPGGACAISFAASIPSCWKFGGMRMSVTNTWGVGAVAPPRRAVVVVGRARRPRGRPRAPSRALHTLRGRSRCRRRGTR